MLAGSSGVLPATPVAVTLFRVDGGSMAPEIAERLSRDVLEVAVSSGRPPLCAPPAPPVAVLYLAPGTADPELRDLIRWAARARSPVGLIGCCPGGSSHDAEAALAAGFDDFVIARVASRELAGRIRAVARRVLAATDGGTDPSRFGAVRVDPARHEIWLGAHRIVATEPELRVMRALVAARGRTLSRVDILEAAWGDQALEIRERTVDQVVTRLRRKLGEAELIVTVRGIGFRLAER